MLFLIATKLLPLSEYKR